VAYRFLEGDNGEGIPVGLLKAQTAVIFNTGNTPLEREVSVFSDPLQSLWQTCILEFCGVKNVVRRLFGVVISSTPEQRQKWLEEVKETLAESSPGSQLQTEAVGQSHATGD
jgi:putative NADPH-quinone reductase